MSRTLCKQCERLLCNCLCADIVQVNNQVEIIILQHPNEVNHPKGTGSLTHQSLKHSQVFVGEILSDQVLTLLSGPKKNMILFPETEGFAGKLATIPLAADQLDDIRLVVLDATWKKAKKMLYLNPELNAFDRLVLHPKVKTNYQIRKAPSDLALSTIEATGEALAFLECNESRYQPLHDLLDALNQQFLRRVKKR